MEDVTTGTAADSHFLHPPSVTTADGATRRAGFELEYAGVSLEESARIVQNIFGGREVIISTFERRVETDLGTFQIEIDASLLKDKRYEAPLRAVGLDPQQWDLQWIEDVLLTTFATVVPIEIGAPPIPITELTPLEDLRTQLYQAEAKGTRASIIYVFGMHINPQIVSDDPAMLRDVLRAFILLYPWLKDRAEVDLARRISPYVNPFPDDYARLILSDDCTPSRDRLIDDYIRYNPTRNRALDMLPVLAHLDCERVMALLEDSTLVKPRPAFHYRLPNCMIDEPQWTLAREWNRWVMVERLAHDPMRLSQMSRDYLAADEQSLKPLIDKWPAVLDSYLNAS